MMWSQVDFSVNKMYWTRWGPDAALPFRIANLQELFGIALGSKLDPVLVGRTARHLLSVGELREDHDDDIAFPLTINQLERELSPKLASAGFVTIRRTDSIWSVARFDRYVDIHPNFRGESSQVHAHGRSWTAEVAPSVDIDTPDPPSLSSRILLAVHQIRRSPRTSAISLLQRLEPKKHESLELIGEISLNDFLGLKFDFETAINWEWRASHVRSIAWPGATIEEILDRLDLDELRKGVSETPMGAEFPEPINLSMNFWKTGNNFFIAPMLAGFRHGVLPYNAANLYIRNISDPNLYSLEYYEGLPEVSEAELPNFLLQRPIAVKKQSVRSGRHRVATMIGRLARGLPYIPFQGVSEA